MSQLISKNKIKNSIVLLLSFILLAVVLPYAKADGGWWGCDRPGEECCDRFSASEHCHDGRCCDAATSGSLCQNPGQWMGGSCQICGLQDQPCGNGCCPGRDCTNGVCCCCGLVGSGGSCVPPCSGEGGPCGCCNGGLNCVDGTCRNTQCGGQGNPPNPYSGCCSGLVDCNGLCETSCCVPNEGNSCGNCGTIRCNGNCGGQGPCARGTTEWGGNCGAGGCGTDRRDCDDGCQWGGWYCSGETPNYGNNCNCNGCGCGGTVECGGGCSGAAPTCNNPKGAHDSASCNLITGWTCDADNYAAALDVHIYKDGPAGGGGTFIGSGTANVPREPAVGAQCGGNANHGFSITTPAAARDLSTHPIYVYAINIATGTGNPLLPGSPRTIGPCCTDIGRRCRTYTSDEFWKIHRGQSSSAVASLMVNGSFYACPPTGADIGCCVEPNSCVFNGVCYANKSIVGDVDNDGIMEKCIVQSPGNWINEFETNCVNGLDDDFDGLTDCQDNDCNGVLSGNVKDINGNNIFLAYIYAKQNLVNIGSDDTNTQGIYNISSIPCGSYDVVATHSDYVTQSRTSIPVQQQVETKVDFTMVEGSSCEGDCTFAADNLVHASCDDRNGCNFYDDISKAACDLSQPGWERDYDSTHFVVCPSGSPQLKVETKATVTCSKDTLVKAVKLVMYKGKPTKLVVAVCD